MDYSQKPSHLPKFLLGYGERFYDLIKILPGGVYHPVFEIDDYPFIEACVFRKLTSVPLPLLSQLSQQ